nr:MBL fold metallo-hydrolase [Propylenella binzhouense]
MNTCFHFAGTSTILIDCGATALPGLKRLGLDPNAVDAVLLSHLHGDHFGGIPFFLLDAQFTSRRERPLAILGPEGCAERIARAQAVLFPGSERTEWRYPLDIREIAAGGSAPLAGMEVSAEAVVHPSGAPSLGLRIADGARVVAYSGDTEWTESLPVLADGADLFICECYAFARRAPYHLDYGTLAARRADLRAKRILLTHMNAEMLANRAGAAGFDLAEDGMTIEL